MDERANLKRLLRDALEASGSYHDVAVERSRLVDAFIDALLDGVENRMMVLVNLPTKAEDA